MPPPRVQERCQEITALLRSRGLPGAILDAGQDLAQELARPDLFLETS